MDKNTIIQLNQLNQRFYLTIAKEFSDTRSQAWTGWLQLLPSLNQLLNTSHDLSVLDVGCGNGRFAQFLQEQLQQKFQYWGLDNNQQLLDLARSKLLGLNIDLNFANLDLIDALLNDQLLKKIQQFSPNVVTLFGVMHHIPTQQLRTKLLRQLSSLLQPESLIIFTCWQFADDRKFQHKIVDPQSVGINPSQLEPNDYILDWQRGQAAYRYCHHLTQSEIEQLLVDSNLELIDTYRADGKTNQLNRYIIAKPKLRHRV